MPKGHIETINYNILQSYAEKISSIDSPLLVDLRSKSRGMPGETLCLAEGLRADGILHTIERDKSLVPIIQEYLAKAGKTHQVQCHIGQAMELIPTIKGPFDLVFIDADKRNTYNYYKLVMPHVRKGGMIIVDNMF
jgi:16S rRNA G966 N2-methylase RsmD